MTPHPSGLTPPPYKNKQDYKGGTNDKTHDSHTHDSGVSKSDDASVTRNLDAENKNAEDDEYIDGWSIYSSSSTFLFYAFRFLAKLASSLLETPLSCVWESCVLSFVPPF